MYSRHLIDTEILKLIEWVPDYRLTRETLEAVRIQMRGIAGDQGVTTDGVKVSEKIVRGPAASPDIRLLISEPAIAGQGRPAILHVHGGGFVMGAPEQNLLTDAIYATELNAVVVSPAYRLAPETVHPGPVEDCYAALTWLQNNAEDLGVDRTRIAISGESAGGGLAAALTILARDREEIPIVFQHLIFPDDRTATNPDISPFQGEFLWTQENNRFAWEALLGVPPGGADISPYAAPARVADPTDLPPTFMICGALDLFLEEDLAYARRLMRAGVPTEFHVYPGALHGFTLIEAAALTTTFNRDSMAAFRRAFGPAVLG
jgi:acetyl esterase/lipase